MKSLKQAWIWSLLGGLALGFYVGYHTGVIHGYEQALSLLKDITYPR